MISLINCLSVLAFDFFNASISFAITSDLWIFLFLNCLRLLKNSCDVREALYMKKLELCSGHFWVTILVRILYIGRHTRLLSVFTGDV